MKIRDGGISWKICGVISPSQSKLKFLSFVDLTFTFCSSHSSSPILLFICQKALSSLFTCEKTWSIMWWGSRATLNPIQFSFPPWQSPLNQSCFPCPLHDHLGDPKSLFICRVNHTQTMSTFHYKHSVMWPANLSLSDSG